MVSFGRQASISSTVNGDPADTEPLLSNDDVVRAGRLVSFCCFIGILCIGKGRNRGWLSIRTVCMLYSNVLCSVECLTLSGMDRLLIWKYHFILPYNAPFDN